jgi:hypothetical protein
MISAVNVLATSDVEAVEIRMRPCRLKLLAVLLREVQLGMSKSM